MERMSISRENGRHNRRACPVATKRTIGGIMI
jgi:hypothetical protein